MENIPATLQYPKLKLEWDLSLPVDVPISVLLPQIINQKQITTELLGEVWQIQIRDSGDFIKPEQTLGSAGILPGDFLVIKASIGNVPDFSKTEVIGDSKAVLIAETQYYLVNKKITVIGREDGQNGIFPEIDLTTLDSETKVSRLHAQIICNKDVYVIRDLKSKYGTFINGEKLDPETRRELASGDILRFGVDGSGVVMKFKINS